MDNKKTILTEEGLSKLKLELNKLVTKKRPKIVRQVQSARDLGDLSENAGYQSAREDLQMVDRRIEEITELIKTSTVSKNGVKANCVDVGTKVTLKDNTGNVYTYEIVGVSEADPLNSKISYESPIGKAIFKKRIGDTAKVTTPIGLVSYEITNLT